MTLPHPLPGDHDYGSWLQALKEKLRRVQHRSALAVNREMLAFYWELAADLRHREASASWGDGLIPRLSRDLKVAFPGVTGFSVRNIKYMRQWFDFYRPAIFQDTVIESLTIGQQAVAQLDSTPYSDILSIPWGHNLAIISACKTPAEAAFYVAQTQTQGWSRAVLVHQIESDLYARQGTAQHNFVATLSAPTSDLAQQTLKDPFIFDFMTLTPEHTERELELALVQHLTSFLLELGAGFAFVGRQVSVMVGEREFFLDLLFYHTRLHCYIVLELKTGEFEPEHAGKLNFYLKAVDTTFRRSGDGPTIGLLLCKNRDRTVVEYALSDIEKPIGVSQYRLLPPNLRADLPSIETLETELRRIAQECEGTGS